MKIPHVNIGGPPAGGKTEIATLLSRLHNVITIPRVTTRPPRPDEEFSWEYEFVSQKEFSRRLRLGTENTVDAVVGENELVLSTLSGTRVGDYPRDIALASVHQVPGKGGSYLTGVPHPRHWPDPKPDTEFFLSVFGESSPYLKEHVFPHMINVFVTISSMEELEKRLVNRNLPWRLPFWPAWMSALSYLSEHPETKFDHVVYNDGTAKDCAAEIERIVGLRLAA